jgi:hypothetical protein
MFIKEVTIYIDYLKNRLALRLNASNPKDKKTLDSFRENLSEGIRYYKELFSGKISGLQGKSEEILKVLAAKEAELVEEVRQ